MYTALYRKWRPLSFDDVISQPHITTTLKNQIKNQRTAHAYLFTGSRGTGKTTCARIFAKAVNCANQHEGSPCLECEVCRDADNFALSDIIEIDAASNNGVDDIRDLRDGAVYTPERCRYKIYIIDEVHMLTPNAFNALLKIMEEPPDYVKFILATTEVHKVPPTITSRCQRFDFRRILPEDIVKRLLYISEKEGLTLDEQAASLIAALSDGGMRDALSLLDQCAAYSDNISAETVSAAAGIAGRDSLFEIVEAAAAHDTASALEVSDRLYSMSKDMGRLCTELTDMFRDLMLIKVSPKNQRLIACMPDELERLKIIAADLTLESIMDRLTALQDCSARMTRSLNKRVELEMCLIRLCSRQTASAQPAEKAQSQASSPAPPSAERQERPAYGEKRPPLSQSASSARSDGEAELEPKPAVDMKTLKSSDFKPLMEWTDILDTLTRSSPSVSGALSGSRAYVHKNIMLIDTKNRFFLKLFKVKENFASLQEAIKNVMGKPYVIKARCSASAQEEHGAESLVEKAKNSGIETAVK